MKNKYNLDKLSIQGKYYLLTMVANLYYNENLTEVEIAERLYTSRTKVSRMLKEARELKIVEISINELWERNLDFEQKIEQVFHLNKIRVVKNREEYGDEKDWFGTVVSYYLDNMIHPDMVIGISWGNTIYNVVSHISDGYYKNIPITVVPIMGGGESVLNPEQNIINMSQRLSLSYGGKFRDINSPLFTKDKESRDHLLQKEDINETLNLAKNADLILTSVGAFADHPWGSYLNNEMWENLAGKGTVGCIGGHFYDINGHEVESDLKNRMIAVSMVDLKNSRELMCVANGEKKANAVLGALRGEILDTLILDEYFAQKIIDEF